MASTDNINAPADQQSPTVAISESTGVQEHGHSCDDPTHNHDHSSFFNASDLFSNLSAPQIEQPAKRKSKKPRGQGAIRAETIPGNRGSENIDDLVNFINSPAKANDKKQKKKSTDWASFYYLFIFPFLIFEIRFVFIND